VKEREALAAAHPEAAAYRDGLANSLTNLGIVYRETGRPREAEGALIRAVKEREALAAAHPENPGYAVGLGGAYVNLGNLSRDRDDPRGACDWYDRAVTTLGAVSRRVPRDGTAQLFLRNAHLSRAGARARLGRHREAVSDWDQAIGYDDGGLRDRLRLSRAASLARSGDHARAAAEALVGAASIPPGPRFYELACVEALAAAAARGDRALTPAGRADAAGRLAARAVGRLGQARAAGFFRDPATVARLDGDPDLDPIRSRPDFRAFRLDLAFPDDPFAR
jgi:tetratricopeptide (TPR) repeat protein